MVTLTEAIADIKAELVAKATYLQVDANRVSVGVIGENETEVFNVRDSFVRLYAAQRDFPEKYIASPENPRLASLMVLCGIAGTELSTTSQLCYELAERVEMALHEHKNYVFREQAPIFAIKNTKGISIYGVPFYFAYKTSAGDPNA